MKEKYVCVKCGEVEDVWFCEECGQYYCALCTEIKSADGNVCKYCYDSEKDYSDKEVVE